MRVYGLNVFESFLGGYVKWVGLLVLLFAAGVLAFGDAAGARHFYSGALTAATAAAAVLLLLGSAGVRQNRAALDLGLCLLLVSGVGWSVEGALESGAVGLITGAVLLAAWFVAWCLRREAFRARFKPRFFNYREFQTLVQVADAVVAGEGREVLHPIEVAVHVDHSLARMESDSLADLRRVLRVVEWLLPLLSLRPLPFSWMGTHERRAVIRAVLDRRGVFRDVARALKTLACLGYYGHPKGMESVGFVPFERRERSRVDQSPASHAAPGARP
jgi:hypothetical protein